MSYPAISLATATVGRYRCPQKRLQTARQPPVYPNSSPRIIAPVTPSPPSAALTPSIPVHRWIRAKGASAILSRDQDIYRHQVFNFGPPRRPKGYYVTSTLAGTRPGGAIAAAWAVMNYLGEEGYLRLVDGTMRYIKRFQDGINAIEGLFVLGEPAMSLFDYTSTTLDIYAVATGMEDRGWMVSKGSYPFNSIHFMQSPGHEPYVDAYLRDLEDVVELVASGGLTAHGPKATYT